MTEQKKEYILDAFSELEDIFVAEAAEFVKVKAKRNYWRELAAAAACIAAVLVTAATFKYLPIGRNTKTRDEGNNRSEAVLEVETTIEEMNGIKTEGTAAEGSGENISQTKTEVPGDTGEETTGSVQKENYSEKDAFKQEVEHAIGNDGSGSNQQNYSRGYDWELVADAAKGIPEKEEVKTESLEEQKPLSTEQTSCSAWKTAEEILAEDKDIFLGKVTNIQVYRLIGKAETYFSVATVEVEEVIRGELKKQASYRIYLPVAQMDGITVATSISGKLDQLTIGSHAVFIAQATNKDTGIGSIDRGDWLCYADFADYYLTEGGRYVFLETEEGVSYADEVYEIPGEDNVTLEDVTAYLREMVEE